MSKLARNILTNNFILESDEGYIRSGIILKMYTTLKKYIKFKLVNKLSIACVNWHKNKMRVQFAAQILSASTVDSLHSHIHFIPYHTSL